MPIVGSRTAMRRATDAIAIGFGSPGSGTKPRRVSRRTHITPPSWRKRAN